MKKIIFLLVLSIGVVSCSDSLTNYDEVVIGEEFWLKAGESVIISQKGIVIRFKSVDEDSRCPIDLRCFWEGNAAVVLRLKDCGFNQQTTTLNTSLEPKNVEFSNLIISLKELAPYPESDKVINQSDYWAKLVVNNKEN